MSDESKAKHGTRKGDAKAKSTDKADRLAAALRDNLRKRKRPQKGK